LGATAVLFSTVYGAQKSLRKGMKRKANFEIQKSKLSLEDISSI
jgi:hypothetical protein